jgi:hydrogenase maturation protease
VIGVGSRRGDDQAGLLVAERLRRVGLPGDPEILARERPGLDLLDDLAGLDGAVLVDAMRGGGPPGAVRILGRGALARVPLLSTHAIGVAPSLALADALGRGLPPLRLVGVEVAGSDALGVSAAVMRALPEACAAVSRALAELAREAAAGVRGGGPGGSTPSFGAGELL